MLAEFLLSSLDLFDDPSIFNKHITAELINKTLGLEDIDDAQLLVPIAHIYQELLSYLDTKYNIPNLLSYLSEGEELSSSNYKLLIGFIVPSVLSVIGTASKAVDHNGREGGLLDLLQHGNKDDMETFLKEVLSMRENDIVSLKQAIGTLRHDFKLMSQILGTIGDKLEAPMLYKDEENNL